MHPLLPLPPAPDRRPGHRVPDALPLAPRRSLTTRACSGVLDVSAASGRAVRRGVAARGPRVTALALVGVTGLAAPAVALIQMPVPRPPVALPAQIEGLAGLDPQQACAGAQPGVLDFRDMVLATYPGTSSSGIVRSCGSGSRSEHKEGRAWDWRVNAYDSTQRAQADALLAWLVAPDSQGRPAAMARRLGVMYVIWNRQMWSSYEAGAGWQRYTGPNPHTDHVHFSFSWAGALGRTSFWDGGVSPPVRNPYLGGAPQVGETAAPGSGARPVLRLGASGPAVADVQRRLGIGVDGGFGPATQAAVVAFQTRRGLVADGVVGAGTWRALDSAEAERPAPASARPVLEVGDEGASVAALQRLLGIRADGGFGPVTERAVRDFQAGAGLTVDGVVGPATWRALDARGVQPVPTPPTATPVVAPAAPPPAPAAPQAGALPELERGDRGDAVRDLQRRLGISTDGIFGPGTDRAVRAFQAGAGLGVDGVVGPRTWRALLSATPGAPPPQPPAPASAGPATPAPLGSEGGPRPELEAGDRGDAVRVLQRGLGIGADGIFGPGTERAVRAFQAGAGLGVDGVVGPRTWAALLSGAPVRAAEPVAAADPVAPPPPPADDLSGVSAVELEVGDRGDAVRTLQTRLGVAADGIFGPGTERAVRELQASRGLLVDGVVGPQTWAALRG